jgi:CDP-glucose 4,6-dehydratase
VIGGGDWSEDRLIPDAIRAWQADAVLQIRRPDAVSRGSMYWNL